MTSVALHPHTVVECCIHLEKSVYIRFAVECHTNIIQPIHYLLKSCVHAADTAIDVGKHSIHHVFLQCGFGQKKVSERSRFWGILTVEGVIVSKELLLARYIVGLSLMSSQHFMI